MTNSQMFYLVLSGNSGAGKSTLLRSICHALHGNGAAEVESIDERRLHHPLLPNMFRDPTAWALPIQINFAVQRTTALLEMGNHSKPTILVMERCLEEDRLFFDYYLERGCIAPESAHFYEAMRLHFLRALPRPNLLVHLRASSDFLVERLELAQKNGSRPVELGGSQLREYIKAMNRHYERWSRTAGNHCEHLLEVHVDSPDFNSGALVQQIEALVLQNLRNGS